MPRELPNLDWLRVFASAATSESFALAASELSVTPGAVSQRIKALEAFLDVELFTRYAQGVRLTEAGRRYAQRVLPPLEQLIAATRDAMAAEDASIVRLTILPALAVLWLGLRIGQFHAAHPGVAIEMGADAAVVDLRGSNFDVAIRYGQPPFAGCDHHALFSDALVAVAAPEVLRSTPRDAQGLPIGLPLMLDTYWAQDFDTWLNHVGHATPANLVTQTFSLYSMAVEATVQGRGFMIGHIGLVGDLIRRGKLQPLSDRRMPLTKQYYLLTKAGSPLSPTAWAFVDWVLDQAATTRALD